MPTFKSYEDSPLFIDGTEISAAQLNVVLRNTELIKAGAYFPSPIHSINKNISRFQNNSWIWRGGFQYRTGLTTARFVHWTKKVTTGGDHDIVTFFDGVEVDRFDLNQAGTNIGQFTTRNITITGRGYVDFQIITVEIYVVPRSGSGDGFDNESYVWESYTFPLSSVFAGTWPGAATFGSVNSTNLNKLSNGLDYLANRIKNVPSPCNTTYVAALSVPSATFPKNHYWSFTPTNANRLFQVGVFFQCQQDQSYVRITLGSITQDFGPFTLGSNNLFTVDIDVIAGGLSYDTTYLGTIAEIITIPHNWGGDPRGLQFSRFSMSLMYMRPLSYTFGPTPTYFTPLESMAYSSLKSKLQGIANDIDTAHTQVVANTIVFDRAQMFRARYGINKAQDDHWNTAYMAHSVRVGELLWVKGIGVKIGYGPFTIVPKEDAKGTDQWQLKFAFEEELISGDKVAQSYFYTDQFPNLYQNMPFFIFGTDITYAAEHLK